MAGYWDGPEGEECPRRTWLTTRVGAATGLVGAAYRVILLQPGTALAAMQMAAADTVTMAMLGAVFGLTTCLSAEIREKPEDPLNYFIGGCTSGALIGARRLDLPPQVLVRLCGTQTVKAHNYLTGTMCCLGFGITAALMKIGNKEGWRLTGPPKL